MPHNEDIYLPLDSSTSKDWGSARIFKVGATLIGGIILGLLAASVLAPTLKSTTAATSTSLFSMSALTRPSSTKMIVPGFRGGTVASLPGPSKWKELALAAIEANNRCELNGPKPTPRFAAAMANMKSSDIVMATSRRTVQGKRTAAKTKAEELVGAMPPLGFWDPAGLATDTSAGRIAYFREAELKHGRVCMLASLGIIVGERYHPLFGGNIDKPAVEAIQSVELTWFWPAVLAISGGVEIVKGLERFEEKKGEGRVLKEGLVPGDLGYDPLGLKDTFSVDEDIEAKELANGRLAMLSTLGILAQELAFPQVKMTMLS